MEPQRTRRLSPAGISVVLAIITTVGWVLGGSRVLGPQYSSAASDAIRAEDFELAEAHLALARRSNPEDPEVLFESAQLARRQRQFLVALDFLASAEKNGASASQIRLEELLIAIQRFGSSGNEVALWDRLDKGTADEARIREALADIYYREAAYVSALREAERWTELEPQSGRAWLVLALVQMKLEDKIRTVESYSRAVELNPNSFSARLGYGVTLSLLLRHTAAAEQFEIAFRRNPRHKELRIEYGSLLADLEQTERAFEISAPLLAEHPNDPLVVGLAGRVALQQGRINEAEPMLKFAAEKLNEPIIVQEYQRCLIKLNKHEEAKKTSEWHMRLRKEIGLLRDLRERARAGNDPVPRYEIARILFTNGFGETAAGWLRDALRVAPDFKPAHLALADYYDSIGKTAQGSQHRRAANQK